MSASVKKQQKKKGENMVENTASEKALQTWVFLRDTPT